MKRLSYLIAGLITAVLILQIIVLTLLWQQNPSQSARLQRTDGPCFTLQAVTDWHQFSDDQPFLLVNEKTNAQIMIEWWPRYRWEKANQNVEEFLVRYGAFNYGEMETLFDLTEGLSHPYTLVRKVAPANPNNAYGDYDMAYVMQTYRDYVALFVLIKSGKELPSDEETSALDQLAYNFAPGCYVKPKPQEVLPME
ncbi:hypothetical protein COV81_03165 [Candidatus Peregrinibacteria bacterium CG11_big_fil_rev_8_21_14_0_20_41_10]|nr:MAG: hypothetical protein COV81_03165 [Candidatus Peregrinibacteria bacterium CG11_big_fil_rev_8_21_14_0_20_41_10]